VPRCRPGAHKFISIPDQRRTVALRFTLRRIRETSAGRRTRGRIGSRKKSSEAPMAEPVSLIMRQFLAWVAERPRRREDVREAWRSCPRISVWEDAVMDELVAYGADGLIGLTARGHAALARSADEAKPRHCEEPRSGDEAIQRSRHDPWIASSLRSSQ
jgi:hypothetical protein